MGITHNKLLITGLPHSGKSTLLKRLIEATKHKQGFITLEVREGSQRIGFELVTAKGTKSVLASTRLDTPFRVSKYGVDVGSLDSIIPEISTFSERDLLYIDEIGQMELFSDNFKRLVKTYLDSKNNFVGTISKVYSDDFTKSISSRDDIQIIEITPENRDDAYTQIRQFIK